MVNIENRILSTSKSIFLYKGDCMIDYNMSDRKVKYREKLKSFMYSNFQQS